jgi:hypothetical protein
MGKTYAAFQSIWRLWKAGAIKRILFLADRNTLVDQTKADDFKPFGQAMTKVQKRWVDKSYETYLALYEAVSGTEELRAELDHSCQAPTRAPTTAPAGTVIGPITRMLKMENVTAPASPLTGFSGVCPAEGPGVSPADIIAQFQQIITYHVTGWATRPHAAPARAPRLRPWPERSVSQRARPVKNAPAAE